MRRPLCAFQFLKSRYFIANYLSNNFNRVDNAVLKLVGERVWLSYPSHFVRLCVRLTQGAEEAAVSGVSSFQQLWGVIRQEEDFRLH
jgi:hypothetical protein